MNTVKLSIALDKDDNCITISDIVKNTNLKHQEYHCPNCNTEVIARIGKVNSPHFSHKHECCNLTIAQESALHLICKEILQEEKCISLPKITESDEYAFIGEDLYNQYCYQELEYELKHSFDYASASKIKFNYIEVEYKLDNIKPDIIIGDKEKLLIEIAVTHFIDDTKLRKIQEHNYNVLEINMSAFMNQNFTREEIKDYLINSIENKKWINYVFKDNLYQSKLDKVKNYNLNIINKYEENLTLAKEKEKRKKEEINEAFNNLENKDYYGKKVLEYRSDDNLKRYLKNTEFDFLNLNNYPLFLDIEIFGEIVFQCDRRIWQTDLFYNFVYNRKNNSTIRLKRIINYIYNNQNAYKIDSILATKHSAYNLLIDVIKNFLLELSKLGFIDIPNNRINYYTDYSVVNRSLTPPDRTANSKQYFICERCNQKLDISKMRFYIPNEKDMYGICERCEKTYIA